LTDLGQNIQAQGRAAEAEPLFREALEIRRRVLGAEHPHALAASEALAGNLERQHRYAEAEKLEREALGAERRVNGPESSSALAVAERLAIILSYQKRYDEAEKMFRDAIQSAEKNNEPDAIALAWYNFACGAAAAGKRDDAFSYLSNAVERGYPAESIGAGEDLRSLRGDPRLVALVTRAKELASARQKPN
jgi:tetratricopeptide (TPR) repeat protein